MWVAWVRVGTKWQRIGRSVLRRSAWDRCEDFKASGRVTRAVLKDGQHPTGPTLIAAGETVEWDGRVWLMGESCPF